MSTVDTITSEEIKNLGRSVKNIFMEKRGDLIPIPIEKIQISEFMTRANSIDEGLVADLMNDIKDNSFIPTSAVWVNNITDIKGESLNIRLIAGQHRYEACRRMGLKQIPCLLFYNLSDEEECILDRVDNEKDEKHKPYNFMETADHYKYLHEVKGWSIRQIARVKNVSKSDVTRKLQIANLPEEIKVIFMTVPIGDTFQESYFRDICRLKSIPHQVLMCKKILDSGNVAEMETGEVKNITASEVKEMVDKLLIVENQGKIAEEALAYIKDEPVRDPSLIVPLDNFVGVAMSSIQENNPIRQIAEQLEFEIFAEMFENRDNKGLRFLTSPMWLNYCYCKLTEELCLSSFYLLQKLVSYDLRYQPERDNYFFITHGKSYNGIEEFLAEMIGVKLNTLEKKIFPALKNYINFKKTGEILKFQVKWDVLYELYKKNAHRIPFEDGGLENISKDFTGWIRPTPYHGIYIENGIIKKYEEIDGKKIDKPVKNTIKSSGISKFSKQQEKKIEEEVNNKEVKPSTPAKEKQTSKKPLNRPAASSKNISTAKPVNTSPVANKLREMGMAEPQINFCINREDDTMNVLKHINELPPAEKENIKNIPGFIYKLVKDGFKAPEGFETCKQVEERQKRKAAEEEFVKKIEEKFKAGEVKYFLHPDGKKYKISVIPNNVQFLYEKNKGLPLCARFSDFMDERFFSG